VLDQATASVVYDPPVPPTNTLRLVMPDAMINDKYADPAGDISDSVGARDERLLRHARHRSR
jgi:hypothetical protein